MVTPLQDYIKIDNYRCEDYLHQVTNIRHRTTSELKASLKRWVFNLDLKTSTDGLNLMNEGISFQSFGAATEKALSP